MSPGEDAIPTADDGRVHEDLAEDECRRLLEKASVGRLAYSHAALPAILPASFTVHDQHVVIAERLGSPVARALRGAVVAFGVDSWDGATATGWSVNAIGPSRVVSTPEEVARLDALQAFPRPLLPDRCYITVLIQLLRGWRTTAPAAVGEHLA